MVAGNGGQMAGVRLELKEETQVKRPADNGTIVFSKTLETEGRKPGAAGKARDTSNGEARRNARDGRGEEGAESESGCERLNDAADTAVKENSNQISESILSKALKGDLSAIRLLVMLAERKKPREKPVKKSRGPTMAMRLAAQPKWEGGWEEGEEEE